ncbi:MAG: signal peptidase I [Balneolaceae bacterium]|nr:signal peptidase I [Balneolaceae bacterium]
MAEEVLEKNNKENARRRRNNKQEEANHWAREWLDALLFAAVAALIIRTFFFEAYRIPTPSMEETLLTGDFLVVSKISYGPRTPMVIGVPFTNIYLPGVNLPWTRLPGYTEIERNDIVVFNYPIDISPISVKTNYIKRSVGIPGDTLSIRDKMLYINGDLSQQYAGVQKNYVVQVQERVRLSPAKVANIGATLVGSQGQNSYRVNMTTNEAETIRRWPEVQDVNLHVLPEDFNEYSRRDFSFSAGFMNHDHLPQIVIPFEGQEVTVNRDNWHIYENIITRYERNNAEWRGNELYINGELDSTYTIRQDYYFMMGDNRDNSEDSRYWGFVPQDHIVGKAGMIYFSWDAERWLPRFNRLLNFIHN